MAGATLVLTCRSPCRKSAGAHTQSALHPAHGHTVIHWQWGIENREHAPAGHSALKHCEMLTRTSPRPKGLSAHGGHHGVGLLCAWTWGVL